MAIVVSIPILLLSLFLSIPFFYSYFYHFAQQRAVSASAQRQQRVASAIDDRYGPLSPAHVQYSTVQYGTSQHGTAQCSSVVAVDVYLTFCTSQRHACSFFVVCICCRPTVPRTVPNLKQHQRNGRLDTKAKSSMQANMPKQ